MTALVIGQERRVAGKPDDHIAPDAEVRAERVDEDQDGFFRRAADDLMMDRDIVYAGELHVCLLRMQRLLA